MTESRHSPTPRERREAWLARYLRFVGTVDLLAAVAVVMPTAWMSETHAWLGMGSLPAAPIVGYLTRSISMLYASQGALLWFFASDVRRYDPAIRCFGQLVLGCSATLVAIDVTTGMPTWWLIGEGVCVTGLGGIMLTLSTWARRGEDVPAQCEQQSVAERPVRETVAAEVR